MPYNAENLARVKDIRATANQLKAIIDELETRIGWLEELSGAILGVTNSVITNLTKEE